MINAVLHAEIMEQKKHNKQVLPFSSFFSMWSPISFSSNIGLLPLGHLGLDEPRFTALVNLLLLRNGKQLKQLSHADDLLQAETSNDFDDDGASDDTCLITRILPNFMGLV